MAALSSSTRTSKRRRCNASPANYQRLEQKNLLTTITVATAEEFVDALATASADETIERIRFRRDVDSIQLDSTAEYSGAQRLMIDGNDVRIGASDTSESTFDLFASTGGGNLILRELTFLGGLDAVHVDVPETADGVVSVSVIDSVFRGSSEFGLHIDDLDGSAASINLYIRDSLFAGNGVGALDFDGIRVDERGEGGIRATFLNSRIAANGGDGVELDEAGDGGVRLYMQRTQLVENGFF